MDQVPAAILIAHDTSCRNITGSRFASEILRAMPGDNLSKTYPECGSSLPFKPMKSGVEINPDELPVQRAAAEGITLTNYELDLVFEDGVTINLLGNAAPLRNPRGDITGAVAAFMDITEKRSSQEALSRAHDELELRVRELRHAHGLIEGITRGTEDMIAAVDAELRYIYFNDAYRREFKRLWEEEIEIGTSMFEAMALVA